MYLQHRKSTTHYVQLPNSVSRARIAWRLRQAPPGFGGLDPCIPQRTGRSPGCNSGSRREVYSLLFLFHQSMTCLSNMHRMVTWPNNHKQGNPGQLVICPAPGEREIRASQVGRQPSNSPMLYSLTLSSLANRLPRLCFLA